MIMSAFVYNADPPMNFNHAATVVELPNGDLLAAWYAGTHELAPDVAIYGARLARNTTTWSAPFEMINTPGFSEGNPVLFVDPNGLLWCFYVTVHGPSWIDARLKSRTSHDGGETWSDERVLSAQSGMMSAIKPIVLQNGELLLPVNKELDGAPDDWSSWFFLSQDGGSHWQPHGPLLTQPGNIQPTVQQLPDGRLVVMMRPRCWPGGKIWQAWSDDNGRTWSTPVATTLDNPNARVDLVCLASGNVALVYNDSPSIRNRLTVALSLDGGYTWPYRRVIQDGAGMYDYPAMIQAKDGTIHIVYSHSKNRMHHVAITKAWLMEAPTVPLPSPTFSCGLTGTYFFDAEMTRARATRNDPCIDFSWDTGEPLSGPGFGAFAVRWRGTLLPPVSTTYTLTTTAADGVRVWLDENLLIDAWHDAGMPLTHSATVTLEQGNPYPLHIEFYKRQHANNGCAQIRLLWSIGTEPAAIIAPEYLRPV